MSAGQHYEMSVKLPESAGLHVRRIIITIVIVVAVAYGVDLSVLPWFPRL
ncbi:hypothetical protein [Streptosporangium subroseum]|nr:hypothetical protein OHB15_18805 [Streptosporangium subroseum]